MKIENFKKKIGLSKTTNSTLSAIKSNEKILLKNVPGSFMGSLSYAVIQQINGNHLFILSEKEEALYFFNDLENLYNKERGTTLLFYPASYRRPYQIVDPDQEVFIDGLKDKCLGKLKNSPMRNKKTNDATIQELQNKLNNLSDEELDTTFWEIETGEFFSNDQIKELENNRNNLIIKLDLSKKEDEVYQTVIGFCKSYEELCQKKYPEAPLPLEILKSIN